MIAGVAAGVADYLGVDPTVVRIVFVVLAFVGGTGLPLYLAGWLLIPDPDRGSIAAAWLHPGDQRLYHQHQADQTLGGLRPSDRHHDGQAADDRRPSDHGASR